nr:MAG TPA: hypothetical protein [Caudoviricetes sp.]
MQSLHLKSAFVMLYLNKFTLAQSSLVDTGANPSHQICLMFIRTIVIPFQSKRIIQCGQNVKGFVANDTHCHALLAREYHKVSEISAILGFHVRKSPSVKAFLIPILQRFPIIIKEIFLHKFLVRSDYNPKSARVYVVSVFKISFIFHVLKNLFFMS